jgi:hypothetical protein
MPLIVVMVANLSQQFGVQETPHWPQMILPSLLGLESDIKP